MNFYKIKLNTFTGKYYVYRKFQSVVITTNATPNMKTFMNEHEFKKEGAFIIWEEKN